MNSIDADDRAKSIRTLNVSRETVTRLGVYVEQVLKWQRMMNLVAPSTLPTIWSRHILDSAQLLDHAPAQLKRWVDIGSGGGFPGLAIAALLADRIAFEMILVESDQRKASFLRTSAREMGLDGRVEVIARRIETVISDIAPGEVISARALAPLDRLAHLTGPHLLAGALGIFPKGAGARSELTRWGPPDTFSVTLAPSRTHPDASIAVVRACVS